MSIDSLKTEVKTAFDTLSNNVTVVPTNSDSVMQAASITRMADVLNGVDNPVGSTIELVNGESVFGNYLKADGSAYNKADYPELSSLIANSVDYINVTAEMNAERFGLQFGSSIISVSGFFSGKYFCFYDRETVGTVRTYVAISDNASVDFTFPMLVKGSGVFYNYRVLGDKLFLMTDLGAFYTTDLINFTPISTPYIVSDIAYNGVDTYVGVVSRVYGTDNDVNKAAVSSDLTSWTVVTTNNGRASGIVWCGDKFFMSGYGDTTSSRISTDGVTWTNVVSTTYVPHNFCKPEWINNTLVLSTQAEANPMLYSVDLVSFVSCGLQASNNGWNCSIAYFDGKYYVGCTNTAGNQQVASSSTIYGGWAYYNFYSASSATYPPNVTTDGVNLVVSGLYFGGNSESYCFYKTNSHISANITSAKLTPSWRNAGNSFIGDGYAILVLQITSTLYQKYLLVADSEGYFRVKSNSTTNYHYFSGTQVAVSYFAHYAKDAKIFYYLTEPVGASVRLYYADINDDDVWVQSGSFGGLNISSTNNRALKLHSNGLLYLAGLNACTTVYRKEAKANVVIPAVDDRLFYMSQDGSEMNTCATGLTLDPVYSSTNYGFTWNRFDATVYNALGSIVAPTDSNRPLYRVIDGYVPYDSSFFGTSLVVSDETKGVGVVGDYMTSMKKGELLVSDAYIYFKSNSYYIRLQVNSVLGFYDTQKAWHELPNGDLVVSNYGGAYIFIRMPKAADASKFTVPRLSTSSNGKAVYIKAK